MTQPQDKMRAEFEVFLNTGPAVPEWARGDVFDHATPKYPGEYRDMSVQMMWDAWQAACAQQSAQASQDALDAARDPLTYDQIEALAKPFVRSLGGDHWYSGEDGIPDRGQIEEFARAIEAAHGIVAISAQGASNV